MKNAHRKERNIRRIPPTSSSEVALDDGTPVAPTATEQESATQRLSLPVTSDGRIDVARLRAKSKSALRHALSDPALPVALGITSSDSPAVDSAEAALVMKQITAALFTGVSAVSVAFAMRSGYPPRAASAMMWNPDDVAAVTPLTSKVIQKRLMPLLSDEWRDEAILAYQVVSIIGAKVMLLREAATHPPHAHAADTANERAS